MTTDFRALCAELVDAYLQLFEYVNNSTWLGYEPSDDPLLIRARVALFAPEQGPTDDDLLSALEEIADECTFEDHPYLVVNAGRALLARWGRPAVEPVPVAEPGVADEIIDGNGTRWDRTMDAALWAKAFCLICPEMASREDVMIGWFANALMAGWDHHGWKIDAERKPIPITERLPGPEDCAPWPDEPDATPWAWATKCVDGGWEWTQLSMPSMGSDSLARSLAGGGWTHWLPHWALPVPQEGANG